MKKRSLKKRVMKQKSKKRGGKMPSQNDSDDEEITQTTTSQVEENNNDDNVHIMRDIINGYNRRIGQVQQPIQRNAVIYPEVGVNTPPRRDQMPDYDFEGEIIAGEIPGAPRRNRRRPEVIEEIEENELFERPVLTRQNALNARELQVAFPPMYDSDTDEEIIVDDNDDDENQLPRQGGRKRKTTKKRKINRKRKSAKKRKTSRKRKTIRKRKTGGSDPDEYESFNPLWENKDVKNPTFDKNMVMDMMKKAVKYIDVSPIPGISYIPTDKEMFDLTGDFGRVDKEIKDGNIAMSIDEKKRFSVIYEELKQYTIWRNKNRGKFSFH